MFDASQGAGAVRRPRRGERMLMLREATAAVARGSSKDAADAFRCYLVLLEAGVSSIGASHFKRAAF